ncbi:hypothetical protein DPMN_131323 [Dreissena polymorpha]|uniref:Uncharacterized protein n=2 Tax=Dreissena polymorpha TaxID=45954 RepID=A0A9D4K1X7_DREPO|nr:hypothetical protein DPMN_131323 [Dreissena polymorpha]
MEKYRKYDYELRGCMSAMASFGASAYLEYKAEGNEYNDDGFNKARQLYTQSLESNIICNYMRYASFLFCNGEYDKACTYFDVIEKQIEEDKKSNPIYQLCVFPSESLALEISKQDYGQIFKQRWSVFLVFTQAEAMCSSEFLRCEMYRWCLGTVSSTEKLLVACHNKEDSICVQIEPYLYYLQYLTYRVLNQGPKQSKALMKLLIFTQIFKPTKLTLSNGNIFLSHFDTSLNMLGHCLNWSRNLNRRGRLTKRLYKFYLKEMRPSCI